MRYLTAYLRMLLDGAGHRGAKAYARNQVRIAQRLRAERVAFRGRA